MKKLDCQAAGFHGHKTSDFLKKRIMELLCQAAHFHGVQHKWFLNEANAGIEMSGRGVPGLKTNNSAREPIWQLNRHPAELQG